MTVKLTRSGGFAGLRRADEHTLAPGTDAHAAALEVLRIHRLRPAAHPTGRPDGFTYDLAIASPSRTVLHRTFRDPLPDDVADLVVALAALPPEPV